MLYRFFCFCICASIIACMFGCSGKQYTGSVLNNTVLVLRVEYFVNRSPHKTQPAYVLIDPKKLSSFDFKDDSIKNSPNIVYNFTYNGGFYISNSFSDLFTMGCCEYGDIQKTIVNILKAKRSDSLLLDYNKWKRYDSLLLEYDNVKKLSIQQFSDSISVTYKFTEGDAHYIITVWSAELYYCLCKIHMESFGQHYWGNNIAYIRDIGRIQKPDTQSIRPLLQIFSELAKMDSKYHEKYKE